MATALAMKKKVGEPKEEEEVREKHDALQGLKTPPPEPARLAFSSLDNGAVSRRCSGSDAGREGEG